MQPSWCVWRACGQGKQARRVTRQCHAWPGVSLVGAAGRLQVGPAQGHVPPPTGIGHLGIGSHRGGGALSWRGSAWGPGGGGGILSYVCLPGDKQEPRTLVVVAGGGGGGDGGVTVVDGG